MTNQSARFERVCTADWQIESFLVASGSDVMRTSTDYVGGLIDDVIFSTAAGDDVTKMSYDSVVGMLYVGVTSDRHAGDYIARIDLHRQPTSR